MIVKNPPREKITLKRGKLGSGLWYYNNKVDAITLQNINEFSISLLGTAIFLPETGTCSSTFTIYNENEKIHEERILENYLILNNKKEQYNFLFNKQILIKPNETITICNHQNNHNGSTSNKISYGEHYLENDLLKVKISSSKKDTNGTSKDSGAFPEFYFIASIESYHFTKNNFYNLLNFKNISDMQSFIAKEYTININYLIPIGGIIYDFLENQNHIRCIKCKNNNLEYDVITCKGYIYTNPTRHWGYKSCDNYMCEDCIDLQSVFYLTYEEQEEKKEFDINDLDLDLYDANIFYEEIPDIEKKLKITEIKVCNTCYQDCKKNNDCKLCQTVYDPRSLHYQKCKDCELYRVCRKCIRNDFINNRCPYCHEEYLKKQNENQENRENQENYEYQGNREDSETESETETESDDERPEIEE